MMLDSGPFQCTTRLVLVLKSHFRGMRMKVMRLPWLGKVVRGHWAYFGGGVLLVDFQGELNFPGS